MAKGSQERRSNVSGSRPHAGLHDATRTPGQRKQRAAAWPALPWGTLLLLLLLVAILAAAIWRVFLSQAPAPEPVVTASPVPAMTTTARPPATTVTSGAAPQADGREHLWMARPLARAALRDFADRTYLYGASKNNAYRIHHGLDMVNPTGTPVQAAADGIVVFAGKDSGTRFGPSTIPNFYGNLVLVKLSRSYRGQDVFYLNGHLDSVNVREGQQVREGDILGKVGMTGTADGPHLHFEVRVGGTTYSNTRNAALWLRYLPGTGGLVSRITDRAGKPAQGVIVTLLKDIRASDVQRYWGETSTYPTDPLGKLNSDEDWGENVAFGDLPVGQYEVRVNLGGQTYLRELTIYDGRTAWLTIQERSATE